jgi:aarF domain-containing kinase
LSQLPRSGQIRPWYRRFWPLTITFTAVSAGIPIGYIIYRDFLRDQSSEENFDENSESVSQSELDTVLSQTQQLLNSELYLNRSSAFIVPIRLFFRTLKLIIIFTPVLIFYFFQDKFAPQLYEKWCFTLKKSFEYSGACFIKLGQWMATRPDLFSAQFCEIFNELHSNAPVHSESKTRKLLHDNNINIKSTSNFLSKPLASGAIAQVYRCKVGNLDLTMKVRHPGVQNEIYYDLKILNIFTRLLTKFVSKETFQWLNIEDNIQAFTKNMLLQTNLMIETKNLQIFERNFQKYQTNIRFPHVDPSLPSTEDILFQSYENGLLLNDFMKTYHDTKVRKKLAYLGVNAYLKMLFVDNFVSLFLKRKIIGIEFFFSGSC